MKHLITFILLVVTLQGQAQIGNPGFENWGVVPGTFVMYPSEWNTLQWESPYMETDACKGDYALTVNAWYAYLARRVAQPFPINSKPLSFRGCYKYTENMVRQSSSSPIETDTAMVQVYMTRWNNLTSSRDTIGFGTLDLHQSLSYSQFICPINYTKDQDPDSVTVILDPSLVRRYTNRFYIAYNMTECSFLTVDDLSFSDQPAGVEGLQGNTLQLYPNPATTAITVETTEQGTFRVQDVLGRMVVETSLEKGVKNTVDISQLGAGVYTYLFTTAKEGNSAGAKLVVR